MQSMVFPATDWSYHIIHAASLLQLIPDMIDLCDAQYVILHTLILLTRAHQGIKLLPYTLQCTP